ncbi:OmpP1/FadL family transporter [Ochrovirga pacifica]|uniref:OmpP1/FadL family transporter n=1 Tax=Ochrovirga pacifica TaxID=1042376 RepID=UPI0002559FF6|nr:aromatic hydrocarbon degradation membrane protein [Ochrovirga pacifica]
MKTIHFIYTFVLLSLCTLQAQNLNYTDLGVLYSQEQPMGTARFTGLNGSMGAVGGDLSAISVNPASSAVFNHSEVNITLGVHNYNNESSFYNTKTTNSSSLTSLDQLGGAFVFNDNSVNSGWHKVVLAVNYQVLHRFDKSDIYRGNSGYATFAIHPNAPDDEIYTRVNDQTFRNYYEGKHSALSLNLSGAYEDQLYFGGSLNFHSLDFQQSSRLHELNLDNDDHLLDASLFYDNYQDADGFSIDLGFIYKPTKQIRLAASFQSPTWFYNVDEDYFSIESYEPIDAKGLEYFETDPVNNFFQYQLNTPLKLTLSSAVIIGKGGFINIDYTYKSYQSLNLDGDDDFSLDNQYFSDVLQNTHNVTLGAEARLGLISLRGGLGYQQSPFQDDIDERLIDVLKIGELYSGSLGIGARFGNSKVDVSYRRTSQTNTYDFYDQSSEIESTKIDNSNSRVGITYTYIF